MAQKVYHTRGRRKSLITDTIEPKLLETPEFFAYRLRIKEFRYNEEKLELELSLVGKNISSGYIIAGYNPIISFLEDMQAQEGEEADISKLKGRTLEGIFNKKGGELYGLCATLHKGDIPGSEHKRLKKKIEENRIEMRTIESMEE